MQLEEALALMRARSDELKASGPGRVDVDSIHSIDEVRVLRECRAALSTQEQFEIKQAILELESHLVGIEVSAPPEKATGWRRLKQVLFGGGLAAMATREGREHEEWNQKSTAAGGPAKLPPPKPLLDAAEAWLIAGLVEGRTDVDTSVLTRPWLEARVTSHRV